MPRQRRRQGRRSAVGLERLESRTLMAQLTYLTPGSVGISVGGQSSQSPNLQGAYGVSVPNGEILLDSYPLGLPGGRYDPYASDERDMLFFGSAPYVAGTVQSGGDYGAYIPVRIDPQTTGEQVGDPVLVQLFANTPGVNYQVGGQTHLVPSDLTPASFNASIGDIFEVSVLIQSSNPGGTGGAPVLFHMDVYPGGPKPDLAPTSVAWASDGGVDLSYSVSGANLTNDTTVGLYWADGTGLSDVIGSPIASFPVQKTVGTYTAPHIAPSEFPTPPANATNLLVVIDPPDANHPNGLINESDETNNAMPLYADIAVESVKWHPDLATVWQSDPNAGGVTFKYKVQGAVLAGGTPFNLRWASGSTLDKVIPTAPAMTFGDSNQALVVANTDGEYTLHVPAAQLSTPPAGTTDLLAIGDPPDAAHPLGPFIDGVDNNVADLAISAESIVNSSVHYSVSGADIIADFLPAEGDNPPTSDQPGQGALTISLAQALLGVSSFNWIQTITLPAGWNASSLDLMPGDYATIVSSKGVYAAASDQVKQLTDPTQYFPSQPLGRIGIPDPLVESPGAYQSDGTLSFMVVFNRVGQSSIVALASDDPSGTSFVPPDSLEYYYNLGAEADANTKNYELEFYDGPTLGQNLGVGLADQFIHFTTLLAGVQSDHTPMVWSGLGTNFSWDSNAVSASNISFFKADNPAIVPPAVSGGIAFVANDLPQSVHPPVIAGIPDQTVDEGSPLTLTVTATDPDPGLSLTYSLDPGAPAGASIDPVTGVFTWTPPSGFATVTVIVRVTDNGSPAQSTTQSFKVMVNDVPPHVAIQQNTLTPDGHFTAVGVFTDPGANTWSGTIDYGDGAGPRPLALAADKTFSIDHQFPGPGHYTATIVVTDSGGLSGTLRLDLAIDGPGTGSGGSGTGSSGPPPVVTSAGLVAVGASDQLIVSYSNAMNPGRVLNAGDYSLVLPGKGKKKAKAKTVPVIAVSYDAATHTATFRIAGRLTPGQILQVTIRGTGALAIEDASGQALDGNGNGAAGSDAMFLLKVPRPGKKAPRSRR